MKSIGTKFYVFIGVFIVLFSSFLLYRNYLITSKHIYDAIESKTAIQLQFDLSIRKYIGEKIRPLMYTLLGPEEFIPEAMSTSYVARSIFEDVRKEFPDYILKFSSDNPRNPINQAGPEELKLIDFFNKNTRENRWTGEVTIDGIRYLAKFNARRMEDSCQLCHGDSEVAPAKMIEIYGTKGGFNREIGDVLGLDTIAVPVSKINAELQKELYKNFILLSVGLIVFFSAFFVAFKSIVIKPLSFISMHFLKAANQDSYAQIDIIANTGEDEIGHLSQSFNVLADKLRKAHASLEIKVEERTKKLHNANKTLQLEVQERQKAEQQKEKTIERLEAALVEIKTLRGIIPICAKCHKIRDDEGYWQQVDHYITKHTEAVFSHGMCKQCSDELYGGQDWYEKAKKEGKISDA
ncbi:DUF3365 domain-containing protein [Candidatus Pacearchaeota archaeon]|nr:DUF3365 domain-containing protein [Candidatus Pacearchaeota archaeon]